MRSAFTFVLLIVGAAGMAGAQVADTSAFRRLDLPAPNAYRSAGGAPGHAYWQNRADYAIEATLDTVRNEIRATGRLHYENNSPDALQFLWLQLDQNIFAEGSINQLTAPPPLVFAGVPFNMTGAGFIGGFTIDRLEANGRALPRYLWDTMLRVDLPSPLAPGEAITLDLAWRFPIPEMGAGRMGRDGRLYEIAQWYPRFAVYDDVNGWNTLPYIGAGEFYLEYGDFDVRLSVPASFIVAATGTLENPGEVLTEQQRVRLLQAQSGREPVSIITAEEAGNPARTRPRNSGTITWHFRASNVRDVAFACAPNFRWDATTWNGILVQTFYRPQAARWEEAIRMARHTIQFFSEQWATYPWPQFSTVEGPIQGMEYPMITFVPNDTSRTSLHWTLMHEFGHEWFPMMVGNDERRYPWMDEGFNTFIDLYAAADYFRGTPYADSVMNGPLTAYPANARPGDEQPLITAPTEVRTLYWNGYQKPALMMRLLREEVLGPEGFDRAFREYVRRWSFKHPQPADFFRTMENVSGRDLDWYWREWVYTTARLDQAIDSVLGPAPAPAGPNARAGRAAAGPLSGAVRMVLSNRRDMVMPAELKLFYEDGTSETRRLPVEIWNLGSRFVMNVDTRGRRLVGAELDPRRVYPDAERRNNVWGRVR